MVMLSWDSAGFMGFKGFFLGIRQALSGSFRGFSLDVEGLRLGF